MMCEVHVEDIIEDYVLGLLSAEDNILVDQHVAICLSCRNKLGDERNISQNVRKTFAVVTRPPNTKLDSLRPESPSTTDFRWLWFRRYSPKWNQLGTLAIVLLVVLASVGLKVSVSADGLFLETPTRTKSFSEGLNNRWEENLGVVLSTTAIDADALTLESVSASSITPVPVSAPIAATPESPKLPTSG